MANIANVTVKKADGTTDIVYTAINGSSGDKGEAFWRQEDVTLPQGLRPTIKMSTSDNGSKTARKVHLEFLRPTAYTDSTTGLKKQALVNYGSADFLLSKDAVDAEIAEAVHQFTNFIVITAVRDSIKAGFSPT